MSLLKLSKWPPVQNWNGPNWIVLSQKQYDHWPVTAIVGGWKGKITDKVESILRKRSIQIRGKKIFWKKSVNKYFEEVESRLESKEFSDKICESNWPQCCFWCCRELSHCRNNKSKQINSTRCPRNWISFLKDFSFWFNLPGNVSDVYQMRMFKSFL